MKRESKKSVFLNKLKGSRNITFPTSEVYEEIRRTSSDFLKLNGCREVILSSFDYEETFTSSVGEDSDIAQKEMFTFSDKKGRKLALRPEGTACIAKMFWQREISKNDEAEKVFYWSNMFRYERPQKGRYREFWQLGVELINSSSKISSDCELLYLCYYLLRRLEIENFLIHINYLGGNFTANRYSSELKRIFSYNEKILCGTCKSRYLTNPLRILDCEICSSLDQIPKYSNFLSENEIFYFEKIKKFLLNMKISFFVDEKLVRGISYYEGLVFECKSNKANKVSFLGGGRYDNLVSKKKENSSVGFALGVDRIVDFFKQEKIEIFKNERKTDLLLISLSEEVFLPSWILKKEIQNKVDNLNIEVVVFDARKSHKISSFISMFKPLFSILYGKKEEKTEYFSVINHFNNNKFLVKKELIAELINRELNFQKEKF